MTMVGKKKAPGTSAKKTSKDKKVASKAEAAYEKPFEKAPDFSLKDYEGKTHSLSGDKSKFTVLYFYPKDSTPGCTIEAKDFSGSIATFNEHKTRVIGISGGDESSKKKFCETNSIKITLLSDPDFSICKTFKAYGEKNFMGKNYLGILRKTYLLDSKLSLLKVWDNVKPEGHAQEVLKVIKEFEAKEA